MAYFNYFIKCIIRKFVNFLFKPKTLLFFILIFCILFVFQLSVRAEWTDTQIRDIQTKLLQITEKLNQQITNLEWIEDNTSMTNDKLSYIDEKLGWIDSKLYDTMLKIDTLNTTTSNIYTTINNIYSELSTLNSEMLNIYNLLDKNQQQLLAELKVENQSVLNELNMIRESIVGSESTPVNVTLLGETTVTSQSGKTPGVLKFYIPMEYKYTYKITVTYNNITSDTAWINYLFYDKDVNDENEFINASFNFVKTIPGNTTSSFTITSRDYTKPYLYLTYANIYSDISVEASIEGILDIIDRTNQEQTQLQQQQNQLQQQQNQLQQEQNNFLRNDNVTNDFSNLPSDTTQDITEGGFNNIFSTLYNTFTTGTAQDLVINIPFTNKSFVINTKNVYGDANLGLVKTLIQTFWYFIISYFIVKDIGKKINKIKSGNIEDVQEDNIKEDML